MPYETAAELTNKADLTEPEEKLRKELPAGQRLVSVLSEDEAYIEREVSNGTGWAEVAVFTHPNASHEWAEELANELADNDEYRVVFDWNRDSSGAWSLEVWCED